MKISELWRWVTLVSAVPLIILLCACGGSTTATATIPLATPTAALVATPSPPAGWKVHREPSFQISLPTTWQPIPLDDATLKSQIDTASTDNPHLADSLRGLLDSGQYKAFLFYAADATSTDIVNNVSIAKAPTPAGISAEEAEKDYAQALPQVLKGAKLVAQETALEINGSKAGEVDYDLPLVNAAGQVVTIRGVQYLFFTGASSAYVVTVTGDATKQETFVPLARQIGKSFLASP